MLSKNSNFQFVTTNPGPGAGCNTLNNLVSTPNIEGIARIWGCAWHQEEKWRSPIGFDPLKYHIWKNNWQFRREHALHQIRLQNQMTKTYANDRSLFNMFSEAKVMLNPCIIHEIQTPWAPWLDTMTFACFNTVTTNPRVIVTTYPDTPFMIKSCISPTQYWFKLSFTLPHIANILQLSSKHRITWFYSSCEVQHIFCEGPKIYFHDPKRRFLFVTIFFWFNLLHHKFLWWISN